MLHSSELYEGNADRVGFRGLQSEDGKISYIDCWNYDGQGNEGKGSAIECEERNGCGKIIIPTGMEG